MKSFIRPLILSCSVLLTNSLVAQTFKGKEFVLSIQVTDHFTGRTNLGVEYFLPGKKPFTEDKQISLAANVGLFDVDDQGKKLSGYSLLLEANLYTNLVLRPKWNEYGVSSLCMVILRTKPMTSTINIILSVLQPGFNRLLPGGLHLNSAVTLVTSATD